MTEASIEDPAQTLARAVDEAASHLDRACSGIAFEHSALDVIDVILGLLARQYQLWAVLVLSPSAWTVASYPLLLRGLVDGLIALAWISRHPTMAGPFKVYSAGRLKLLAEHWRVGGDAEQKWQLAYADELEDLANDERWIHLLPVELGSWNGKDIRTMAIEADLKPLYDVAYSPLSAEAHAEWMVLRRRFLKRCGEASHKAHWLPVFQRPFLHTGVPQVATGYFLMVVEEALAALGLDHEADFWHQTLRDVVDASEKIEASHRPVPDAEKEPSVE